MKSLFLIFVSFLFTFNAKSQITIEKIYDLLESKESSDSVLILNKKTNQRLWVKKNRKIFLIPGGFNGKGFSDVRVKLDALYEIDSNFYYNVNKHIPEETESNLNYKLISNIRINKPVKSPPKLVKECNCDLGLFEIEYKEIERYDIRFHPGNGSACNEPTNSCNEDSNFINPKSLTNSYSIPLDSIPPIQTQTYYPDSLTVNYCMEKELKIGVLDTGIYLDSLYLGNNNEYLKFFYNLELKDTPTEPKKIAQINVANFTNIVTDITKYHGTKVVNLIISRLDSNSNVKIIPIKIANQCPGELFDALCGILVAAKLDLDIINTSWGYSGDEPIANLTAKLFYLLEKKNIYVVSSSGNDDLNLETGIDYKMSSLYISGNETPNFRRREGVRTRKTLYPISFSSVFNNIFGVTTLRKDKFNGIYRDSSSNYSERFVDIGVLGQCKYDINSLYPKSGFFIPGFKDKNCYFGTSFAAAIFTGEIAKTFRGNFIDIVRKDPLSFDFYRYAPSIPMVSIEPFPSVIANNASQTSAIISPSGFSLIQQYPKIPVAYSNEKPIIAEFIKRLPLRDAGFLIRGVKEKLYLDPN